jgi:AcrR family transcriptional regulator
MGAAKVGRPARIDRDAIAEAVLELGLGGISMKAVADHLGVSVAGLYHHVSNRRELLVLAAERSLSQARTPEDRGQHWDEWLREWARHVYRSFVDEPEVLSQWMTGALKWESMVDVIDSVIRVLGRAGFDPPEAVAAFDTVARYAVGAAMHEIRQSGAVKEGRSTLAELHATLALRPGELPGVRALLETPPIATGHEFDDRLTTVLVGIAVRRGDDASAVLERATQATHGVDDIDREGGEDTLSA